MGVCLSATACFRHSRFAPLCFGQGHGLLNMLETGTNVLVLVWCSAGYHRSVTFACHSLKLLRLNLPPPRAFSDFLPNQVASMHSSLGIAGPTWRSTPHRFVKTSCKSLCSDALALVHIDLLDGFWHDWLACGMIGMLTHDMIGLKRMLHTVTVKCE